VGDKYVVGVIGGGFIASQIHIPVLSCIREVKIGYVADVRDTRLLATTYGLQSVKIDGDVSSLPDCDIALLAIPVGVREGYIKEFSKRGTAIFSEKPFAIDVAAHERFLGAAKKIACDYMSTCYSSVNQVKSIVSSGVLGGIRGITVSEGRIAGPTAKSSGHYQEKKELAGGGILMERGCQTIAQLVYILEGNKFSVDESKIVSQDGLDIDVESRIHVSGGQDFDLIYRLSMIRPLGNRIAFIFDNAEVEYNHYAPSSTLRISKAGSNLKEQPMFELVPQRSWATSYPQAHYLKWKRFIAQVAGRSPIEPAFETSLDTTRTIADLYALSTER